jgi:putative transposase
MLDLQERKLPLAAQADLLTLNRTSLYYKPVAPSPVEVSIKHAIDRIYTENPAWGSRTIATILKREGVQICRNTVAKYMREMGIAAVYPGPNLSRRNPEHRVYPYLLRNVIASYPNHIWGTDITYIRLKTGWLYLTVQMDWFSRYVIAWELDQTLEIDFVLECLHRALNRATPTIANSDQGCHYTSPKYTDLLLEKAVKISMDGRGRALDNIFTERLWRTVKYQEVYLKDYETPREARQGLSAFLHTYNNYRPHQALRNLTPAEVYHGNYALDYFKQPTR